MTDEKKPPQEVADIAAQIIIDMDSSGGLRVSTNCFGSPDRSLLPQSDTYLVAADLPFLLAELRAQLAVGRRLTVAESQAVNDGLLPLAKYVLLEAQTNLLVLQSRRTEGRPWTSISHRVPASGAFEPGRSALQGVAESGPNGEQLGTPSYGAQANLVHALGALDAAYGRAVRAARAAGERVLFTNLDADWNAYDQLITPVLSAKPPSLFK